MVKKDEKIFIEFKTLIEKLSDGTERTSENTEKMLKSLKDNLTEIKDVAEAVSSSNKFEAIQTEKVFESYDAERKYEEEMLKRQEKASDDTEDMINEMDDIGESTEDFMDDILSGIDEGNETSEKNQKIMSDIEKGNTERVSMFNEGIQGLSHTAGYLTSLSGLDQVLQFPQNALSAIEDQFGGAIDLFKNLVLKPFSSIGKTVFGAFSGIGKMFGGLLGMESEKQSEKAKSRRDWMMIDHLKNISSQTKEDKEMIKGGGFFDKIKNLIPGMKNVSFGKLGGMALKLVGGVLLLGGIGWMISDFIKGFEEEGMSGGFYKAFVGDTKSGIKGSLKNAGKWAMIGGGIGMMIGGPLGGIAGGIIGGAFGFAIDSIAQIFEGSGSIKSKIGEAIFGKSEGGVKEALKTGGRWAMIGAGVGVAFGPLGMIVGGLVGGIVGFLVNMVNQILPPGLRDGIGSFFSGVGEQIVDFVMNIGKHFNTAVDFVGGIFESIYNALEDYFGTPVRWLYNNIIKPVFSSLRSVFVRIGGYIKGFLEWIGVIDVIKYFGNLVGSMISSIGTVFSDIWEAVGGFLSDVKDSFFSVIKGYKSRFLEFVGVGDEDEKETRKKTKRVEKESGVSFSMPSFGGGGGDNSSDKTVKKESEKVVENNEVIKREIVKQNNVSEDSLDVFHEIKKNLDNVVLKFDRFHDTFVETIEDSMMDMKKFLIKLQEDQRRWDYVSETGSLQGYSKKMKSYGREIKKLDRGRKEGYRNYNTNFNNTMNSVQNLSSETDKNLLKKSLRKGE